MLVLASSFCCALAAARVLYSGRLAYAFLCWNLVLAWVPLGLALALARRHAPAPDRRPPRRLETLALGAPWLLFFPNAPYMVTDLMHLTWKRTPVPLWFDALMLFAFALTGLCIAFLSLWLVHRLVERRHGVARGWLFVAAVTALSGFGVYLGRFERWNSWDLVARPADLLAAIAGPVVAPLSHPRTFAMTTVAAALFGIAYLMLFTLVRLGIATATPHGRDPERGNA